VVALPVLQIASWRGSKPPQGLAECCAWVPYYASCRLSI
jgi:hypothetical protein